MTRDIKYNSERTVLLCFTPFSIKGEYITEVLLRVKYLGHFKCNDMKDEKDMRHCTHIYAQGNQLVRGFLTCANDVKVCLFHTYCSSTYTPHLW